MTQPGVDGASPVVDRLAWDSRFWGFPIARLRGEMLTAATVASVDAECSRDGVRCLYFLASADDAETTRAAEDGGFRLVDVRMTFGAKTLETDGGVPSPEGAGVVVRAHRDEDRPALREIARVSYRQTRFFYDAMFSRDRAAALYETWIDRACDGEGDGETVLVAEADGAPIGYVTCRAEVEGAGEIGLVGVAAVARGRGVGRRLLGEAMGWFREAGAAEVTVVTQGRNVGAQRLYQASGFATRRVELWYHKWYGRAQAAEEGR